MGAWGQKSVGSTWIYVLVQCGTNKVLQFPGLVGPRVWLRCKNLQNPARLVYNQPSLLPQKPVFESIAIKTLWCVKFGSTQTLPCGATGVVSFPCVSKNIEEIVTVGLYSSDLFFISTITSSVRRKKCLKHPFISNPDYWPTASLMKSRKSIADWCFPCVKSDFCILLIPGYNLCPALCDLPCKQKTASPAVTQDNINIQFWNWKAVMYYPNFWKTGERWLPGTNFWIPIMSLLFWWVKELQGIFTNKAERDKWPGADILGVLATCFGLFLWSKEEDTFLGHVPVPPLDLLPGNTESKRRATIHCRKQCSYVGELVRNQMFLFFNVRQFTFLLETRCCYGSYCHSFYMDILTSDWFFVLSSSCLMDIKSEGRAC